MSDTAIGRPTRAALEVDDREITCQFDTDADGRLWQIHAIERCRKRLGGASASSDRLALLREIARLAGGRIDLTIEGLTLQPEEVRALPRFGLATTQDNAALRLVETEPLEEVMPGLREAFRLDASTRRLVGPACPDAMLLRLSGHRSYRSPGQKAAVRAVATMPYGATLLVSLPTGGGKSLVFQVMAKLAQERALGTTSRPAVAVIVPTVALALDHARTLSGYPGLEGSRAYAGTATERSNALDAFRLGQAPVLLLSPEAAFGAAREVLAAMAEPDERRGPLLPGALAAFIVDEAHIIETWGRSFRPDFQRLPGLVAELRRCSPGIRIVLLSATLGPETRTNLARSYSPANAEREAAYLEIAAGVPRYEFDIFAQAFTSEELRRTTALELIDRIPRPAIIYTTEVGNAEDLFQTLRDDRGYQRIRLFTGKISDPAERLAIVDAWNRDELDLVVATSAFGMGVDKRDVRAVVHACLPESPARYYQEIGRAARDGYQSLAAILWTRDPAPGSDEDTAFSLASRSWLTIDLATKRWRALLRSAEGMLAPPGSSPVGPVMRLDLDSAREGLEHGDSDLNRGWNATLINLMQRKGALSVLGFDGVRDDAFPDRLDRRWVVEIHDDEALRDPDDAPDFWQSVQSLRSYEQDESITGVRTMKCLLDRPFRGCVLAGVFEAIETDSPPPASCGRCPACRREGLPSPGPVRERSLDRMWSGPVGRTGIVSERLLALGPGLRVVEPLGPGHGAGFADLLDRLAAAGIEQFVVPDGTGVAAAEHLAQNGAFLGLVTEWTSWLGRQGDVALARLPTAFIVEESGSATSNWGWWSAVQDLAVSRPMATLLLVASRHLLVGGRRLGQIAGIHPPITATALPHRPIMNSGHS